MTDELEKLKKAFQNEAMPKPDATRRQVAIRHAMEAFDKKNQQQSQGSGFGARLKETGNILLNLVSRRPSMKLSYILAGSASIAVLSIAILNTGQFNPYLNPEIKPGIEQAEVEKKDKNVPAGRVAATKPKPNTGGKGAISMFSMEATPSPQPAAPPAADAARNLGGARSQRLMSAKTKIARRHMRKKEVVQPGFYRDQGRDKFQKTTPNPVKVTANDPVSTFSIDVDTNSYSFMRASLNRNVLPPKASVRVEEMVNYFPYKYQGPQSAEAPFKANVTIMPTPWNSHTKLLHIGIKGYDIPKTQKPRSNLVFLLDTSGSMNAPNKLPLLKNSFKLLLSTLHPDDTISIVTYAGSAGTVLEPTKAADKNKILGALDRLNAGGSTAGGEGIRQAYQLAQQNFDKKGVNRVILATDGDFNVGITNQDELKGFVERKRKSGIFLSVLGFGMGNYNDRLMQTLAQNGNGNAAYIDSLNEARKVLVEEAGSTLFTIAKDVKIQMEFNPQQVSEYRLIGYETRMLKREDFNNDKVDAGDIGSGHTVTAIYEITPVGSPGELVGKLRYQDTTKATTTDTRANEYGFLKIRYKKPDSDTSKLISTPITANQEVADYNKANAETRFATSVAAFGQLLRGGKYTKSYSYDDVVKLALTAKGDDPFGYRAQFVNLVRLAKSASALQPTNLR